MAEASSDEAAWRDLIARFAEAPAADEDLRPWPAREDLPVPPPASAPGDPLMGPLTRPAGPGPVLPAAPPAPAGSSPAGHTAPPAPPATSPAATGEAAAPSASAAGGGARAGTASPGDPGDPQEPGGPARARVVRPAAPEASPGDEDHYVPPPPPPLPSLDPVAKGAWAALFGGPGYLLVAVMVGWQVPGWAAFTAVAAFVGGFATLVVRMGDQPPRDPDGGAVV